MKVAGATVLLTGATGGLGGTIARVLAGRGAQLVISGRRRELLEPLAEEIGARAIPADLATHGEPERLAAEAGAVDVFVSNAALPGSGPLAEYSVEHVDRALDVNLRAPVVLTNRLLPGMLERDHGHLVFMVSLLAKVAQPGNALYAASKYGLRGFAQSLRADLVESGVGVSSVFPGFVEDAGMFADANISLPRGVGTITSEQVAGAVLQAIERDRGEIDVAPFSQRAGALLGSLAPETARRVSSRIGSQKIALDMAEAQRDKR